MDLAQKLRTVDHYQVAQALPEGSVLVEFLRLDLLDFQAVRARGDALWKPAHYLAFILAAGEPEKMQMVDLGEANGIDAMIASFKSSITTTAIYRDERQVRLKMGTSHQSTHVTTDADISAAVFAPLLAAIGPHRRLLLAPDGDLTRLPFEVLPKNDGRRLIDEYAISYLGTGRDVLSFGTPHDGQSQPPLVVADPDFDLSGASDDPPVQALPDRQYVNYPARGGLHFHRLPGTRAEGDEIATLLGVSPLLAEAALERRVKVCCSPRILHLATHGFFLADPQRNLNKGGLPEQSIEGVWESTGDRLERFLGRHIDNPLWRSGLALAGANTWNQGGLLPAEAEDGILTAEDVSGLDLSNTELVVLSAYNTGLGDIHVGEGVFGLCRAFKVAGAKALVMSLWEVPDQQTKELIADFYARLLAGQPRVKALRAAQSSMKERYPHPSNWGAFICQGNPGPLSV
jgi:CHAT domain-containing protein